MRKVNGSSSDEEEGCGNNGPGTVRRMGLLGTRMKCRGWVGEGTEYSVGECAWERTYTELGSKVGKQGSRGRSCRG